jgi:predicted small lipoprotein YifL
MRNAIRTLLVALALSFALGGCGLKGQPEPPSGHKEQFPKPYPNPDE